MAYLFEVKIQNCCLLLTLLSWHDITRSLCITQNIVIPESLRKKYSTTLTRKFKFPAAGITVMLCSEVFYCILSQIGWTKHHIIWPEKECINMNCMCSLAKLLQYLFSLNPSMTLPFFSSFYHRGICQVFTNTFRQHMKKKLNLIHCTNALILKSLAIVSYDFSAFPRIKAERIKMV